MEKSTTINADLVPHRNDGGVPMTTFEVEAQLTTIVSGVEHAHNNISNVLSSEDTPPNGGFGWVVTACVFLINANTWGVNAAWGVFLSHYLESSAFPGATQLQYSLIGGLSISQSLLISPLVALSNRFLGTRPTLGIGTLLVFAALFSASFSTQIWHLFLTQGFVFGWGMGFLYITATAILPQWFSSKRSLALGFASSGAGLGGLAYNLGAGAAADSLGLPWTYRVLSFCTLAVNLICAVLIRDRNKQINPNQNAFDARELRRPEILLVTAWGFTTELGYIVLLYSLPHYATSILGLSQAQGSVVGAMLSLGLGLGRPVIGQLSDRLGRINVAGAMTLLCGVLCLALWIPARSYALLLVFALLAGTVCGIFWGTVASVTAEVAGLKRLPASFGVICLCLVLPTTFAEPTALEIVSASGGKYLSSQVFVAIMYVAGALCVWALRAWKIWDAEQKQLVDTDQGNGERHGRFWLTPKRLFNFRRV